VRFYRHLGIFLALTLTGWAQPVPDSARILKISVADDRGQTRIEVTLTSPVKVPEVTIVSNPDRISLALPGVGLDDLKTPLKIDQFGVKKIRASVDATHRPQRTTIVVDLREARPYGIAADGNKIVLTLLPAQEATDTKKRQGAAGAASAPLISRIHRRPDTTLQQTVGETQNTEANLPPSPPPLSDSSSQSAASAGNGNQPATLTAPQGEASVPAAGQATVSQPLPQGTQLAVAAEEVPAEVATGTDDPNAAFTQANPDVQVAFRVKYVAEGVAYLEGGRNEGLKEGMKLEIKAIDPNEKVTAKSGAEAQPVAGLEVASVALSSAVGEVHDPTRPVQVGDWAYLSSEDTQALIAQRSLSATRKYPVVIAFSEGDTLDDEARVVIPRPPLPEINRARGRIGFDYSGVSSHDAGGGLSSNAGMIIRTDISRINGTYWNLNGFWRGRINNHSHAGQDTIQDLINRTYTIGLTYDNPNSRWVAGFGRLYLPWATSLDTIDGGYFGRRLTQGVTAGIFAGSSPDPTGWNYDPNRQIGGAFVNFEGGTYDDVRYTSTSGFGLGMLNWNIDRPFVFFENGIFYKRYLSIYHALQADSPSGNPQVAAPGAGVSRSFLTVRLQPSTRVEFDLNHTYFRDIPTYNAALIDTGLLDKYLFQGFSGGVRVQVVKDIWVYNLLGRSNRSGDTKASWNQLYGMTVGRMPWIRTRTDVHYSKFTSSFGSGSYTSASFSRNFNDNLRWEVLGGRQSFTSPTTRDISHFVTGNFEASLGPRYFVQTGYTWNRGVGQNYDQWLFTFGYRFDSRSRGK
jgi:AMIN domain